MLLLNNRLQKVKCLIPQSREP